MRVVRRRRHPRPRIRQRPPPHLRLVPRRRAVAIVKSAVRQEKVPAAVVVA